MKTKIAVLVGIALCTMLLISPALASASESVLEIYGNANEDDTIDMRDLTYVKLIFFGKKPETELADAKYDGKINPLDFIQIKLIIVGKEKELTVIDSADRTVTVKKPIKRIVTVTFGFLATMRSLKVEKDLIVGIEEWSKQNKAFFPEFNEFQSVGCLSPFTIDFEKILELDPDIVGLYATGMRAPSERTQNELKDLNPNIVVLGFDCCYPSSYADEVRKLGYIFDRREEADEFCAFYNGVQNTINERVEGIPMDKRPKVYLEHTNPYQAHFGGSTYTERLEDAGGKNIFSDVSANIGNVAPEKVITCNPEIIVKVSWPTGGYDTDDITLLSSIREEIMNRPELANVIAVKNERVYIFNRHVACGATSVVGGAYMAKWCYPELFKDLDPKAIHQRYLTEFQGLNYDLDKHGVFVYPPFED